MIKKFIFTMDGYKQHYNNRSMAKPAREILVNEKYKVLPIITSEIDGVSITNLELEYTKVIRVLFRKLNDGGNSKFSFDIIGKDIPKDIEREILDEEAFLFEYYSPNFIKQTGKDKRFFPGFFAKYKPTTHISTKTIILDDIILPSYNGIYRLLDSMHLQMPGKFIPKDIIKQFPKTLFLSEQIDELFDTIESFKEYNNAERPNIIIENTQSIRVCPLYPYMDMAIDIEEDAHIKRWDISGHELHDSLANTLMNNKSYLSLDVARTNEVKDGLNIYCVILKECVFTNSNYALDLLYKCISKEESN